MILKIIILFDFVFIHIEGILQFFFLFSYFFLIFALILF